MDRASLVAQRLKPLCLQCGRPGFDPWVGKIPWRRKWQPTPVFLPGESHGGAWRATVHGVAKSRTRLSDFTFTFHFQIWMATNLNSRVFPQGLGLPHASSRHATAAVSTGGDRGLLLTPPKLANHLLCAGKGTHTFICGSLV